MRRSLVALLLCAAPTPALAATGEGSGVWDLFWHAVNLLLLVGVIVYLGRRPIQDFFGERRAGIQSNLAGSAQLLSEAENRLAEWQGRVARLDAEIGEIQGRSRERAEAERERILAEARASAERIRRDAAAAVEQELRRARSTLREQAADLALQLSERLVREQVDDDDRRRLVDEFVERIDRVPTEIGRGG